MCYLHELCLISLVFHRIRIRIRSYQNHQSQILCVTLSSFNVSQFHSFRSQVNEQTMIEPVILMNTSDLSQHHILIHYYHKSPI